MRTVDEALRAVLRADFVRPEQVNLVDIDAPLPIGFGQTISQPTTVRLMLEWLAVDPGNHILDVGSGSGWTTALLAYLAGLSGQVDAVEIVPELVNFGRQNCRRLGLNNVRFYQAGPVLGLPRLAPFDRILVSAAPQSLPRELIGQLAPGGKMVLPVRNDVIEIAKRPNGQTERSAHPGFVFVPLIVPTLPA